ncbi:uncharacterized protein [Miscanthus floridulus]|uniref:uncharacterized protein n=1 Tax=Miscanthus floridulus TaxID=154761 RepID=UPI003457D91F
MAGAAERAEWSEEQMGACTMMEPVPMMDLQLKEALPVAAAVEQSRRSEGQTGARLIRDLQSEDAPPVALEIRKVSSRKSHFLWAEHARMAELEHWAKSACRKSQIQTAEAAAARVEGQRAAERATAAEQGLEAAKARHEEIEAGLRTSLANTKVALQEALAALELEWATLERAQKALEAEERARSEADQEVLAL